MSLATRVLYSFVFVFIGTILFASGGAFAQHEVAGTVTDSTAGRALPGVNVVVKGTSRGTATNADGTFELTTPSPQDTLIFSFVGFQERELPIRGREQLDVRLVASAIVGEDVVITGYSEQVRENITGSVSKADVASLNQISTQSIANSLEGQVAGVNVQTSGAPGEEAAINIRGIGSFGDNNPLYIIDGVQVDNIIDFEMSQLQSVQVMKDAASGAVYGSRAANGVVILETKRGQEGELQVSYTGNYGTENVFQRIDMLERENFQAFQREALRNVGQPISSASANDPDSENFIDDINTDWQEEAWERGYSTKHTLNVSGGNETSTFNVAGSYELNGGTFNGSAPSYEAVTGRVNSEHRFTVADRDVRVGENIFLSKSFRKPQTSILNNGLSQVHETIQSLPIIPVRCEDNLGGFCGPRAGIEQGLALNTIGVNHLMDREQTTNRALANFWGELDIFENLTYRLNLAWDHRDFEDDWFQPSFDLGFFFNEPLATLEKTSNVVTNTTVENTVTFSDSYGAHNVDLLGGYSEEQRRVDRTFNFAQDFGGRPFNRVIDGSSTQQSSGSRSKSTLRSFFTQLQYDYSGRYLVTTTFRRDGSSRFGDENKWGNFPSFSLGWRMSDESFFPEVGWINDIKVRGSWGKVGNQEIADFATQPIINNFADGNFGGERVPGAIQVSLVNEDLKWEVLTSRTIGLDVRLFSNRFEFSFDYYDNTSEDILVGVPLPGAIGSAEDPIANAATIDNTGFEFVARYTDQFFDNELSFTGSTNITIPDNEVQSLGLGEPIFGAGTRTAAGSEVVEFFGWVTDGIFQNQEEVENHAVQEPGTAPGDIRFKDLNNDGVIDDADRKSLGSPTPDFSYGVNLDFEFRNFDASFFFQGNYGNKILNNTRRTVEGMSDFNNQSVRVFENHWTSENQHNDVRFPRAAWNDPNDNNRDSDRWIEDGTYLRLQSLNLGYTFSTGRFGLQNLRVFVGLENVFTITGYSGLDPELGTSGGVTDGSNAVTNIANDGLFSRGVDDGAWPNPRRIETGVEILF